MGPKLTAGGGIKPAIDDFRDVSSLNLPRIEKKQRASKILEKEIFMRRHYG
jgi:hypothetical protein